MRIFTEIRRKIYFILKHTLPCFITNFFRLHFKAQLDRQNDVRLLTFAVALLQCHEDSLSRVLREAQLILTYCFSKEHTDIPLKRNPFREAESSVAGQEITCAFCSPKVHYHAFK